MGHVDNFSYEYYAEAARKMRECLVSGIDWDNLKTDSRDLCSVLCAASDGISPNGVSYKGGEVFRSWTAGQAKDGVLLYARNHNCGIVIAESPTTQIHSGQHCNPAVGDDFPKPENGKWWRMKDIPESALPRVCETLNSILAAACENVEKQCAVCGASAAAAKAAREAEHLSMLEAWADHPNHAPDEAVRTGG